MHMQSINELFGKEVVNQSSGQKIAKVQDVVLDSSARHIVALVMNDGGLIHSPSVIRWSAIATLGDVIVVNPPSPVGTVKDDTEVADLLKLETRITGTSIINPGGSEIGSVSDILVNDQGEVIGYEVKQGLFDGRHFLSITDVQVSGKDAIITTSVNLPLLKDIKQQAAGT
ncbi:MAG: hypothetical protein NVS2B7_36140 [Herpetosiphon sp.]